MKSMTADNLKAAFAGESQAYMKYMIFADKAEKDGKPNIAKMFRAIAFAERVHATNHFRVLGQINDTGDNLVQAKGGEDYEVDEMYPAFKVVAEYQGEKAAVRSMEFAMEAEKIHSAMYGDAKAVVDRGNDIEPVRYLVCEVCGWTGEGDAPDNCPICNAPREKIRSFD